MISEIRQKDKKKLKKRKSQNQINLIERAKKRDEKSVVRQNVDK
jgi:hypothetical protein